MDPSVRRVRGQLHLSPFDASLAYALCVVAFWLVPLWYMYKRKIYIKI